MKSTRNGKRTRQEVGNAATWRRKRDEVEKGGRGADVGAVGAEGSTQNARHMMK